MSCDAPFALKADFETAELDGLKNQGLCNSWLHGLVDSDDCNRRMDGRRRLHPIQRNAIQIPCGKSGTAVEIQSTQLLGNLRSSSRSRRSFFPT